MRRPPVEGELGRARFAPRSEMAGVIMARAVIVPAPNLRCGYATARPAGATPVSPVQSGSGGVAERLKAAVLKTAKGESPS